MTLAQIRSTIVGALQDGDAGGKLELARLTGFERGEQDIRLADLNLDSLMRVELLVALEVEHDAIITPELFAQFRSLCDVAAHVESVAADLGSAPSAHERLETARPAPPDDEQPAPRAVRLFQRALRGCPTVARMNWLLENFESRLTPLEFTQLYDWQQRGRLLPAATPAKFGAALSNWLERLAGWMRGSGKTEPEPFTPHRVRPAAMHYAGPDDRAGKTLLIGFAIHSSWLLWMPQPVLLQHIDARRYDLLLLGDTGRTGFRAGVPQMGATVTEFTRCVAGLELLGDYGRVRTVGCSAGAYPALLTGRLADAEATVCVSGRFPSERYLGTLAKMYFNSWLASLRNRRARVVFAHTATKRRDSAYARRLAWLTGGRRLAIELPEPSARHEFLEPLVEHGELRCFLERTLFASTDSEVFAGSDSAATMRFQLHGGSHAARSPGPPRTIS